MKIVLVNGSPRKGNVYYALEAFKEGAKENNEIEIIEADKLNLIPCKGCSSCMCYKGCILNDETNEVVDKLVNCDLIVFSTPIYWWGMSAQLKLLIDKCYSKGALLKNKKIGLIISGGSPIDNEEYDLIKHQFDLMGEYLKWDIVFYEKYYGKTINSFKNDEKEIEKLKNIGRNI